MMPSAATALPETTAAVRVPLFQSVIERIEEGGRWVILDLGAARPETLALFSGHRCRLDIADLGDDLQALIPDEETGPEALRERAEALLPPRSPEAVDIVLCWDLLNYLQPTALAALSSRLAIRALPGTLVHALIAYRDPLMPAAPAEFCPADAGHVMRRSTAPDERPAPRYTPTDLAEAFGDFKVERAVLLSNGMQEFLFRL